MKRLLGIGLLVLLAASPSLGGGSIRAAEEDHIDRVGIDMGSSGNTLPDSSGPGTIDDTPERCIQKSSSAPNFYIDIYADQIPLNEEAVGYDVELHWSPGTGFIEVENVTEGMLEYGYWDYSGGSGNDNAGNSNAVFGGWSVPPPATTSPVIGGAALITAGQQSWEGPQVVARLEIGIIGSGPQIVELWLADVGIADDESNPIPIDNIDDTNVRVNLAIDQDCPGVMPTPPPGTSTPSTPTPMPTPPPGTILLVGGWNNACYVGLEQPIEDVLADAAEHVLAVYRMRVDLGFDRWFPNRPEVSTITTVSPFQPLFILMSQYGFWPHEPSGTLPASVSLARGWNNVCYTGQTKSVEDATAGVAGGFSIMYQLGSDQFWRRYVPIRPDVSNIVQVSQYDTVLMLVNQEGGTSWTFDP
ncbi:MAG: hypothetical protein WBF66_03415 [Dehalococcoidia bacterium]